MTRVLCSSIQTRQVPLADHLFDEGADAVVDAVEVGPGLGGVERGIALAGFIEADGGRERVGEAVPAG